MTYEIYNISKTIQEFMFFLIIVKHADSTVKRTSTYFEKEYNAEQIFLSVSASRALEDIKCFTSQYHSALGCRAGKRKRVRLNCGIE